MLIAMILATLTTPPDDTPRSKSKPVAMILKLKGKVELRPVAGQAQAAEATDLLYDGEVLVVPKEGSATVSIVGLGVREEIKPGVEVKLGAKGCMPLEAVLARNVQPKAVASTMSSLRAAPGDARNTRDAGVQARKAGVGFRGGPDGPQAISPIFDATVASERPALAWPPAKKATTYRVRMSSAGNREIWKLESQEPRLPYPEARPPLQAGNLYQWEVTDPEYRKVASGKFTVATASERAQLDELKALAASGDSADKYSAALAYRRLGAYAEAIDLLEPLVRGGPEGEAYRRDLDDLRERAGLEKSAEAGKGKRP